MDRRTQANFKLKVREALLDYIYSPVLKRNELRLKELIDENDALVGVQYFGFVYRNKFHTQSRYKRPPQNIPKLFSSLHARMDEILEEERFIEREERPLIAGYLQKWLNSSDDAETLFQRLPTALRRPFQQVLDTEGMQLSDVDMDAAAQELGIGERALDALKVRLMTNLIRGDA
jgi:hypothetical protein